MASFGRRKGDPSADDGDGYMPLHARGRAHPDVPLTDEQARKNAEFDELFQGLLDPEFTPPPPREFTALEIPPASPDARIVRTGPPPAHPLSVVHPSPGAVVHPPSAPVVSTPVVDDIDTDALAETVVPQPTPEVAVEWTRPGAPDTTTVDDGPYAGRAVAGEVGAMLRVLPSVRTKLGGAHIPDSVVDAGVVSDAVSVGVVSVKGASHHYSETPRQDAYAITSDDAWLVVAIADGVSQGKLSHIAAAEAARVAAAETLRAVAATGAENVDWAEVGEKARAAVRALGVRRAKQQVGDETAEEISDRAIAKIMATTCDLLIAPVDRVDGALRIWRVRLAGDGSFYVLDPGRGWAVLGLGKDSGSGIIDNSVGDPFPVGGGAPDVMSWELQPGQTAVLCTDGFGDVIARGATPVGRYLFGAWQQPLDTSRLLATASFLNTSADDDRTAVVLWATA